MEKINYCEQHNQKAFFLCIQDNCDKPVLICNECTDDHLHISIPIKKVEKIYEEKYHQIKSTDQITNKIRSFYHDIRENMLKKIDADQKQIIQQITQLKHQKLEPRIIQFLNNIKQKKFKNLNSKNLKQTINHLETKKEQINIQQQIQLILQIKKEYYEKLMPQHKQNIFIHCKPIPWQFVTSGKKIITQQKTYKIETDCNYYGNTVLNQQIHKWKIVFNQFQSFGCIGFGITSLDTLNKSDVSQGSIISCLCCNGPWSGKSFDIKQPPLRVREKITKGQNSISFELNSMKQTIIFYDPQGRVHGQQSLNVLKSKNNLVPIIKRGGSAKLQFKVQIII